MAVIISNNITLTGVDDYPLTHARILYRNLARATGATVSASTETSSRPAVAAANPNTYESWMPTAMPATWTINLAATRKADAVGIAAHSLGSNGVTVAVQYYNGTAWVTEQDLIPANDDAILVLFTKRDATGYRLSLSGGTGIPYIGVIFVGESLQMQRPIYGGHSPLNLSRATNIAGNNSVTGNWIGRSVIRRGYSVSVSWSNLKADWYRSYFDPFVKYASQSAGPFFLSWRPQTFPDEVGYCWLSSSDISPSNSGTRDLMSVSMSANAYASIEGVNSIEDYS